MQTLEIWGGFDCSFMRFGLDYLNKSKINGHDKRFSDLELFAQTGIKRLRYPCLWELAAPENLDFCDWRFLDERLNELNRLKIECIPSFLYHGSGPVYTSLIDPDFPEKFSTFARHFINRYPWIETFIPINDIYLTAKNSCRDGVTYPHLKDELYFFKAIIHQCRATILAMKEIKRVNPKAKLIQAENLGKYLSSTPLENLRNYEELCRWLPLDLLTGQFSEANPLYSIMLSTGIRDEELNWFQEHSVQVDSIGLNYHQNSNRYLDHQLELYPNRKTFSKNNIIYVDVSASKTGQIDPIPAKDFFKEVWERYRIPFVITETDGCGTRESQMRWFNQLWKISLELRRESIPIEAITAWSLLGKHHHEKYTPGVFDLKNINGAPEATSLALQIFQLINKGIFEHPLLKAEGIWETPRRIRWGSMFGQFSRIYHSSEARPILITGANTSLGQMLAMVCGSRNISYRILKRREMDITLKFSIEEAIDIYRPWAIINTAGHMIPDDSGDTSTIHKNNIQGAVKLAKVCRDKKIALINFSQEKSPIEEISSGPIQPSIQRPEREMDVLNVYPNSLIIRTNLHHEIINHDLAQECLNLLIDGDNGVIQFIANENFYTFNKYLSHKYISNQKKLHHRIPNFHKKLKNYLTEIKIPYSLQQEYHP